MSALKPAAGPAARAAGAAPRSASERDAGAQQPWRGERAVHTAMLLATAPSATGGPAAALRWESTTLLGRLARQLAELGVADFHVVTRPEWAGELEGSLAGTGFAVRVHRSDDRAGDLRAVAAIAGGAGAGALVVANADVLTHGEALAGLLADPRVATGVLVTTRRISRVIAFRTRARRSALIGAATPYHLIHRPNGTFLGVLKLSAGDRAAAADVCERLAELLEGPLPEAWDEELEAKTARWRLTLQRHGAAALADNAGGSDAPEDAFEDEAAEPEDVPLSGLALAPDEEAEFRRRLAAAEQDVTALLLYGLLRSAVRVSTSHVRRLFWARPLSPADVDRAAARIGGFDEDQALLESSVKANDGFFTTYFVSPYSRYIARWAARRGWTPNFVTALSGVVGFLAAAAFALGDRPGLVAGAVLLQIAFTLDCVDGQLARYTRTFSAFGAWLDGILDRTKEYAVFAGLAIGAARTGDDVWLLAAATLTLQTVRHTMDLSFNIAQEQAVAPAVPRPLEPAPRARAAAAPVPPVERAAPVRTSRRRSLRARLRRLERTPAGRWARKIVAFPIGERFAVISLTAALFDARATFVALLALGGFAFLYTGGGRVLRSLGRRGGVTLALRTAPGRGAHGAYRDDGPLAVALGRLVGTRLPVPAVALAAAAALPLLVAAVAGDASWPVAGAVVGWSVLMGGSSSGRPLRGRFRWAVVPILRAVEYGGIVWLAMLTGDSSVPAAFALLSAITFRHYDAMYRTRQRGDAPAPWLGLAAGGWDGRLLLALLLTAAGAAPAGLYAAAAALGALLLGENAASWIARRRSGRPVPLQDDEDDEA